MIAVTGRSATELLELGESHLQLRRLAESIAYLHEAERAGADADRCAAGRWMAAMLLGQYELAWQQSDAIRKRGAPDPDRLWDGSAVEDRVVIVRSLHGFGDAVQNLRFLPHLRERARRVLLEVAPAIVGLARCAAGADEVLTWGEDAPRVQPTFDVQVEITELPYLLRATAQTITVAVPYLRPPQSLLLKAAHRLGKRSRPRVGLVWQSSSWDPSRSIPFQMLDPLLSCSEVELWSVQTAADNADWKAWSLAHDLPLRIAGEGAAEMTAASLAHMDLLISVDTFAAHLAGALGTEVWLLLKPDADWRWGVDLETTCWYPTMRLFRAARAGDWSDLLVRVSEELAIWREQRGENT